MGQYDFSQNDGRWLNEPLGFSGYYFMGTHNGSHDVAAGCYVTSLAMAASYLGHPITPGEMNAQLKDKGLINNNGDIIYNDTLARLYGDIEFIERKDWPRDPAPLDYFNVRSDVNTEIIVLIDTSPASGIQQHWCRVVGWDGKSDIIVVDPWDGVRKGLSAYANRSGTTVPKIIYAAVKFRKRAPEPAPAPAPSPTSPEPAPAPPAPAADPPAAPANAGAAGDTGAAAPVIPATPGSPGASQPPVSGGGAADTPGEGSPGSVISPSLPAAPAQQPAPGQSVSAGGQYGRLARILVIVVTLGLPFFARWAHKQGINPVLSKAITDVVALAALVVAGIAYWHGDGASSGLIIAAVASVYFGHRTAQIQQETKK